MKLVVWCKVLHYTLVKEEATWSQNPKAHKNKVALQEVYRISIRETVYDDGYKIMIYII